MTGPFTPGLVLAVLRVFWRIGCCTSHSRCQRRVKQSGQVAAVTEREFGHGVEGLEQRFMGAVLPEDRVVDDAFEELVDQCFGD